MRITTVGLDADDTLWHNETIFRLTQDRFRALMADVAEPAVLDERLRRYRNDAEAPLPFAGGAMGFLGYELGRYIERLPQRHAAEDVPEMALGFYDLVIGFDVVARRAWVFSSGLPETDPTLRHARAAARLQACLDRLEAAQPLPETQALPSAVWQADLDRAGYQHRICRILDHIRAGDIFQANFTMRFHTERPQGLDPFAAYRALRRLSAGPFAAFLRCGDRLTLASASPERFLSLSRDRRIEARPIKGTRPRSRPSVPRSQRLPRSAPKSRNSTQSRFGMAEHHRRAK